MHEARKWSRLALLLQDLLQQLERQLGFLPPLILFGSWARGTATEESDVDIGMILPQWNWDTILRAWDVAWEVGFRHNRVISLIPLTQWEWQHPELVDLARNLRREGIPLWPPREKLSTETP